MRSGRASIFPARHLDSHPCLCLYKGLMRVGSTRRRKVFYSWKQIAYHLGCNERTCLRWEKELGLPVHRMTTSAKSRVFAYKDELDTWIRENIDHRGAKPARSAAPSTFKRWYPLLLVLPGTALLLFVFSFVKKPTGALVPDDFSIRGSELVIHRSDGKELWTYDTGLERLLGEAHFRAHFRIKREDKEKLRVLHPTLLIKDINGDGKREVLFSPQTDDEFGEGTLHCFDEKGSSLWEIATGRELEFGGTTYSPDYRVRGFGLHDLDNDGSDEILVVSDHNDDFPTQFLIADAEGKILGEYWNSGRIEDFITEDLDGDGSREVILCGSNREYRDACLIVLDAARVSGASPQTEPFRCLSLEPGSEAFYIRLPRTDVGLLEIASRESAYKLNRLANRKISTLTRGSRVYFEFDYEFRSAGIRPTQAFEAAHMRAASAGRVQSTLDTDYKRKLGENILYYDGENWVKNPTRNQMVRGRGSR